MNIYPWHEPLWAQIATAPEKLPHALLLTGPAGLGKLAFAQALAARLLCETPVQRGKLTLACGQCNGCKWFSAGSHPDFRLVQPEDDENNAEEGAVAGEGGSVEAGEAGTKITKGAKGTKSAASTDKAPKKRTLIRIHQIRDLSDFVFLGSHQLGRRIVLLQPAEAMNAEAANSLLKILEEPPPSICFLLVSDSWRKLLPTIRSRCRQLAMPCPEKASALAWLKQEGVKEAGELLALTGGAPLLAREWARQERLGDYRKALEPLMTQTDDPVAMAAQWQTLLKGDRAFELVQLVGVVQKWIFDLLQMKLQGISRYHVSGESELRRLSASAAVGKLLACHDELLQLQAVARHPLNAQLFLEDMAARYLRALAPERNR